MRKTLLACSLLAMIQPLWALSGACGSSAESCASAQHFAEDMQGVRDQTNQLLLSLRLSPEQCYIAFRTFRGNRAFLDNSIKKSAKDYLEEQLRKSPSAQLYYELASLQDDKIKAIENITKAIGLDSSNSQYFNYRGNLYDDTKQYQKAVADYTDAIKLDPQSGFPYQGRFYSYESMGEYDKAVKDLEEFFKTCTDKKYVDMVRWSTCRTIVVDHFKKVEGCPTFDDYVKSGEIKFDGGKK